MKQLIWSPSPERVARANMTAFIAAAANRDPSVDDYDSLHRFSIRAPDAFWSGLWDFLEIRGEKGASAFREGSSFLDAQWFPDARLNYAENLLRRRDDGLAIVALDEERHRRTLTWRGLRREVARAAAALRAAGVGEGDRVASCLSNRPETVGAALATAALGAIWSACSPEYGPEIVVDRLGQIAPKVLLLSDSIHYGGRERDLGDQNAALMRGLPSVERFVIVGARRAAHDRAVAWDDFVAIDAPGEIAFRRLPFDHPLFIVYSSGTAGKPKAIVHGAGGSLLQTVKEMVLHADCRPDEPVLFPVTPGWMVWNVMLATLAWGSPLVLYDGSPTYPGENALFDIVAAERVGIARIVPPLLDAYARAGLSPRASHDLGALRCLVSGSAPLLPHHCDYVYKEVKSDVHLMSPAGGTDIMGTLATGNPVGPVYRGEIQCRSLGMSVEVFGERGQPLANEPGELVCTRPFPSLPLKFWGDPDRARVEREYLSHFPGVWRHGDWAEITLNGGIVIHGRADATLKVNGVRIGTAEIYRAIESVREVAAAAAVPFGLPGDERIALLVVMREGTRLDDELRRRIGELLRLRASARHVPAQIVAVPDLLRSLNGKPSEVAIRDAVNGRPVSNRQGLLNAELLPLFRDLLELRAAR
jgi:acetoacetyl-CoA synthetase